jgi:thiamine pyrophosphokinase
MKADLKDKRVVILADGSFPQHSEPLRYLHDADFIVCCDGAAAALVSSGHEPGVIIGDLDSITDHLAARFHDRLVRDADQETNDLTKAVRWSHSHGATELVIVGATGKREDHTIGNISLLADYGLILPVKMVTDTGMLFPAYRDITVPTFPGQRVSIFSLDSNAEVTATGLEYPINRVILGSWWTATLNSATANSFTLTTASARLIIYLGHSDS